MREPRAKSRAARRMLGALCLLGACVVDPNAPLCGLGTSECGGRCVELDSDPEHCGRCGLACSGSDACVRGLCQPPCGAGLEACDGACVSLVTDPAHCGTCGRGCAAGEICSDAECTAACGGGSVLCGEACVDIQSDAAHCGGCDQPCPPGRACVAGGCQPYAACEHRASSSITAAGNQRAEAVAVLDDGRTVVAVEFAGTLPLGCAMDASAGADDIALAVVDDSGTASCLARIGTTGAEAVGALAVAPTGDLVLVGSFAGALTLDGFPSVTPSGQDGFVVKLDPNGQVLWAAYVGDGAGAADAVSAVAIAADGSIVVGGLLGGAATLRDASGKATAFDPHVGGADAFVARLFDDGTVDWVRSFGDVETDVVYDVAFGDAGEIVLTGSFARDVDLAGDPPASLPIDPNAPLTHRAQEGGFVAALDAAGNAVWGQVLASRETSDFRDARIRSAAFAADGSWWAFGEFNSKSAIGNKTVVGNAGTLDAVLIHLASDGAVLGAWVLGGDGVDSAVDVAVREPFVVMAGYFSADLDLTPLGGGSLLSVAGSHDVFSLVAELPTTAAGAPSIDCARAFGDAAVQRPVALWLDGDELLLAGYFAGEIDFGGGLMSSGGSFDPFVARLGL